MDAGGGPSGLEPPDFSSQPEIFPTSRSIPCSSATAHEGAGPYVLGAKTLGLAGFSELASTCFSTGPAPAKTTSSKPSIVRLILTAEQEAEPFNMRGDLRMNRAPFTKLNNPWMDVGGALRMAGFEYPPKCT
jgi:hypothetical protein